MHVSFDIPSGLELSCPMSQATVDPFSRILAGKSKPHRRDSHVRSSELLGAHALIGSVHESGPGWATLMVHLAVDPPLGVINPPREPSIGPSLDVVHAHFRSHAIL